MKKAKGFSLVENLMAIVLLVIIIVACLNAAATARFYAMAARHHYQAMNLARDRVEDIISGGSAAAGTQPVTIDPTTGLNGNLVVSYSSAGILDVTVTWMDGVWVNMAGSETIVMVLP